MPDVPSSALTVTLPLTVISLLPWAITPAALYAYPDRSSTFETFIFPLILSDFCCPVAESDDCVTVIPDTVPYWPPAVISSSLAVISAVSPPPSFIWIPWV